MFRLVVLFGFLFAISFARDLPLPPLFAAFVGDFSIEPSGLAYCSTTDRIYMNCDFCEYISEMDTRGNFIQNLFFDDSFHDVEAIACSDRDGYLFIGEEKTRKVTAFLLGEYDERDGKKYLIEVDDFTVVTGSTTSGRSGLEGMTVNDRTGDIYVANEKNPSMVVRVHSDGEQFDSNIISYLGDISGLAYDEELDLLWILSDVDEKVYLADLTGTELLDSWDLPIRNPEGITVNNNSDPKYLCVATDPKGTGKGYLPLLFGFEKPAQGTGYANYDPKNLPDYVTNPPPCDGCDEIFGDDDDDSSDDDDKRGKVNGTESRTSPSNDDNSSKPLLSSSLFVLGLICLVLTCL